MRAKLSSRERVQNETRLPDAGAAHAYERTERTDRFCVVASDTGRGAADTHLGSHPGDRRVFFAGRQLAVKPKHGAGCQVSGAGSFSSRRAYKRSTGHELSKTHDFGTYDGGLSGH